MGAEIQAERGESSDVKKEESKKEKNKKEENKKQQRQKDGCILVQKRRRWKDAGRMDAKWKETESRF